jgi:aminopeptidase N
VTQQEPGVRHGLTRTEAAERARLLTVRGYEVELDLTGGPETFRSTTRIAFGCTSPGTTTFLDLTAPVVHEVVLNGRPIDRSAIGARRVALAGLEADNVLVATADCAYSRTGEGLHRFVDPADGEVYTWTDAALSNTNRWMACFDQPDLKAPLTLRVRAPGAWIVLSNGAGRHVASGRWEFAVTPPLSTYLMAVVAGSYHSVRRSHGAIELGVHCRRSLAPFLEADEILDHTRDAFGFYDRIFGVPYPFGAKYDQVFVPEFNAGAMENPACVTFMDSYVFRSRVTEAQRQSRAETIAHELAHMWFGDLVTMRWWDDLWLNESFAEYMGTLALVEATRFRAAWTTFCVSTKAWGYRQDQLPSTHPIAADAPDTGTALLNFDGISYAKGAGVLKQLVAWVGFDAFVAGLRAYIADNAYGNTSLRDLLAALERSSGRDLRAWSRDWLESAGVNILRPESAVDGDGVYRSVAVLQSAPPEHPILRPHRIAVGLYDRVGDRLVRRDRVEVDVVGARTEIPALVGVRQPDLLLLNDEDLTWAKVRLDERSLRTVLDGWLCRIDDSLPRALLWAATWDMVRDAELGAGAYLALVFESIAPEREISLVQDVLVRSRQAIDALGRPEHRGSRLAAFAGRCLELLSEAESGSDLQLAFARAYAAAALTPGDVARVGGWLAGREVPPGLAVDAELRWLIVRRLAALGALGEAGIAAEHDRDRTSTGAESAATARAALPSMAAKDAAWADVVESDVLSNHMIRATMRGFWQVEQRELLAPFVERYFAALPAVWRTRTPVMAEEITAGLFPAVLVSSSTLARTDEALAAPADGSLRRLLLEGRADLERVLRARSVDAAPTADPEDAGRRLRGPSGCAGRQVARAGRRGGSVTGGGSR